MNINPRYLILILVLVLVVIMTKNVIKRKDILASDGVATIVKITRLENKRKGSTTFVTQAFYEFINEAGESISGYREISNNKVKVGFCYNAIYVPSTPDIIEVQFGEVVDCLND